jgi:hypothetical protein
LLCRPELNMQKKRAPACWRSFIFYSDGLFSQENAAAE